MSQVSKEECERKMEKYNEKLDIISDNMIEIRNELKHIKSEKNTRSMIMVRITSGVIMGVIITAINMIIQKIM